MSEEKGSFESQLFDAVMQALSPAGVLLSSFIGRIGIEALSMDFQVDIRDNVVHELRLANSRGRVLSDQNALTQYYDALAGLKAKVTEAYQNKSKRE